MRMRQEDLGERRDLTPPKSSIDEPPMLELKPLPPHLKYIYLDAMEEKLLQVLKAHKKAFAWKVADIKGISPSICMHKILMEEKYSPLMQPQRGLDPKMQEVVKAETIKLLDAGIIYPISDSAWISPVQCVPKKGGITVITNEKNELIPTRTVTRWRVCIDYRKLNDTTRKDHFPHPFIDQILERLAGREFYCFLDGYSGYNKITIAPEDQEKTTFTCSYRTFAFRQSKLRVAKVRGDKFGAELGKVSFYVTRRNSIGAQNIRAWNRGIRGFEGALVTALVLVAPDWNLPFEVMCDASDSAVGAVLGQQQNKVFHTIYYAKIRDKKGVENVVADHLSRLELISNDCVDHARNDWFPDEQLFEVRHYPWYANFANFLATDSMIRRCVAEEEFGQILNHCHDREPTLFKDARSYVLACDKCQRTELEHRAYWATKALNFNFTDASERRLLQLDQLEEFRNLAYDLVHTRKRQRGLMTGESSKGNSKKAKMSYSTTPSSDCFSGKLKSRWSGSFVISKVYPSGAV
ncbi:uncharacterized protein LOC142506947 [Primulina tabacum]|uniref:uncharacterized protein LOC142506947 n=1 Tax=Primulina tabacum TaxID=48773 RepID=UPI003F594435